MYPYCEKISNKIFVVLGKEGNDALNDRQKFKPQLF